MKEDKADLIANSNSTEVIVYVPGGAKINLENTGMDSPRTKYNRHTILFDEQTLSSVIGGEYARKNSENNS